MKATKAGVIKQAKKYMGIIDGMEVLSKNKTDQLMNEIMSLYDNVYCGIEPDKAGEPHFVVCSSKTKSIFLDMPVR